VRIKITSPSVNPNKIVPRCCKFINFEIGKLGEGQNIELTWGTMGGVWNMEIPERKVFPLKDG